jgi:hypothetical protein
MTKETKTAAVKWARDSEVHCLFLFCSGWCITLIQFVSCLENGCVTVATITSPKKICQLEHLLRVERSEKISLLTTAWAYGLSPFQSLNLPIPAIPANGVRVLEE